MRGHLSIDRGCIDPELFALDDGLRYVDELFFSTRKSLKPIDMAIGPTIEQPGTAVDVSLRVMFLKFQRGLSYEEMETELRERQPWRNFCQVNLMDPGPDAETLVKLNQRLGKERT